jgi:hypothetical protein
MSPFALFVLFALVRHMTAKRMSYGRRVWRILDPPRFVQGGDSNEVSGGSCRSDRMPGHGPPRLFRHSDEATCWSAHFSYHVEPPPNCGNLFLRYRPQRCDCVLEITKEF